MTSLNTYYQAAAAAPAGDQRRYAVGAGYQIYQRVLNGESYASARARVMSLPQYANALVAAALDDDLALVDSIPVGGSPPVVRAVQAGTASPGTTVTVPVPGQIGDLMIVAFASRGSNTDTITPPAGWNLVLEQVRGSVGKLGVYSRVAGSSEPASYDFTTSSNNTQIAAAIALNGANTVNASAGATATAAGTAHTCPTVTTTSPNALVLRIVCTAVSAPPISWTWGIDEQFDGNAAATGAGGVTIATEPLVTPGATGTRDATFAASGVTYAAATVAVV